MLVAISESLLRIPCDVELVQTQPSSPEHWLTPKLQFKPDAVVVVGGDGTLGKLQAFLSELLLGCTTQHVEQKISLQNQWACLSPLEMVVSSIEEGNTQTIDTATANGEFMLLMASVGFDAGVVADLAAHRGDSITHLSYIAPIIRQLFNWNPRK